MTDRKSFALVISMLLFIISCGVLYQLLTQMIAGFAL